MILVPNRVSIQFPCPQPAWCIPRGRIVEGRGLRHARIRPANLVATFLVSRLPVEELRYPNPLDSVQQSRIRGEGMASLSFPCLALEHEKALLRLILSSRSHHSLGGIETSSGTTIEKKDGRWEPQLQSSIPVQLATMIEGTVTGIKPRRNQPSTSRSNKSFDRLVNGVPTSSSLSFPSVPKSGRLLYTLRERISIVDPGSYGWTTIGSCYLFRDRIHCSFV